MFFDPITAMRLIRARQKNQERAANSPWSGSRETPTHYSTWIMGAGFVVAFGGAIIYPLLILVGLGIFALGLLIAIVSSMIEGIRGQ